MSASCHHLNFKLEEWARLARSESAPADHCRLFGKSERGSLVPCCAHRDRKDRQLGHALLWSGVSRHLATRNLDRDVPIELKAVTVWLADLTR